MPATVYLVTGGARSGKSSYAERLCEQLSATPIYLATASSPSLVQGDDDFCQRIQKHQQDRANRGGDHCKWTTIEEPLKPSNHADKFSGQVVLVDCLTLWLTNFMMEEGAFSIGENSGDDDKTMKSQKEVTAAVDRAMHKLQEEFETLIGPYDTTFCFVTNEVGSGTHGETHLTRKFVDAQGWCNQFVARKAQQVIHMVCGMPHVLKNELLDQSHNNSSSSSSTTARLEEAQRLDRHLSTRKIPMDGKGYFMIKTQTETSSTGTNHSLIVASFHSCIVNDKGEVCDLDGVKIPCCQGKTPEPMKVWKCRTAKELTTEIFERWDQVGAMGLSVGHAAYIGREAQKAEHSLYQPGAAKYQQD